MTPPISISRFIEETIRDIDQKIISFVLCDKLKVLKSQIPENPDLYGSLAWHYWAIGKYEEAVESYCKLLKLRPNDYDARRHLGKISLEIGDFENALLHFSNLLIKFPNDKESLVSLIIICIYSFNFKKADEYIGRLNAIDYSINEYLEKELAIYRELKRISAKYKYIPTRLLKRLLLKYSKEYSKINDNKIVVEAAIRYSSYLEPNKIEHYYDLACFYREGRDHHVPKYFEENICYFHIMRLDKSKTKQVAGLLSGNFTNMYDFPKGITYYKLAKQNGSVSFRLEMAGAECNLYLKDIESAKESYINAIEIGEKKHFPQICLGLIALQENNHSLASRYFQNAFEEAPKHPLTQFYQEYYSANRINDRETAESIFRELEKNDRWIDRIIQRINENDKNNAYAKFEERSCAICNTDEFNQICYDITSGFIKVKCKKCGLLYVNPFPDRKYIDMLYTCTLRRDINLIRFYKNQFNEYMLLPKEDQKYQFELLWNFYLPEIDLFKFEDSIFGPKRMLDIGCSIGRHINEYQLRGWEAKGIDLDSESIKYAKSKGLDAEIGTLEQMEYRSGYFHLVRMMHIIEHLEEPLDTVREIYRILAPGGLLWIETPCAESMPHYITGPEWSYNIEHLYFFSKDSLCNLVRKAGFEVKAYRCTFADYIPQRLFEKDLGFKPNKLLRESIEQLNIGDNINLFAFKP